MEMEEQQEAIDLTKVYVYEEFPDKVAGRCDNCGHVKFKSLVKDFIFIRTCVKCGMKKSI
ncbi:hypothetical protein ACFX4Y_07305 [Priestia sp. YIM B13446]|uniref:hypothetical protein n=1 Tax=Priestia TaxID=2800373 RepID=UPI0021D661CC|nr:hypothetical protein [Priestia megaterium]MCU7744670.1 hypothetical protein [Priestia megaterium]